MDKAGDKIEELKQLWQVSFGDSKEYTEFFFSRAYREERTVNREADGRIVSSAQFRHFDIIYGKSRFKSVYIFGVCTDPDFRRKGLSADIIDQLITEQAALSIDIAFLILQREDLFDYYNKLGFNAAITIWEEFISHEAPNKNKNYSIIKPSLDKLYKYYTDFYLSLGQAVIKDREYFDFTMDDIIAGGGRIDVCGSEGHIRGFAATDGNVVKELLCLDKHASNTLLSLLLKENPGKPLKVITPGNCPSPSPAAGKKTLGLARIINPSLPDMDLSKVYANLLLN